MGLSQGLHLIAEELAKDLQWALGPLQTVQAAAAKHVVNPASQLIQKQYNGTAVQGAVDGEDCAWASGERAAYAKASEHALPLSCHAGFVARIGAAAGALEPYANAAWRAAEPAWRPAQSYAWRWQGVLDSALADVPPHAVVLVGAAAGVMLAAAASWTWSVLSRRRERTALQTFFDTVKAVPGVSHLVARERGRLVNKIRAGVARGDANVIEALPAEVSTKGRAAVTPSIVAATSLPPSSPCRAWTRSRCWHDWEPASERMFACRPTPARSVGPCTRLGMSAWTS